jgi:peptidyl-tRNA hydrolase, PTH1 family
VALVVGLGNPGARYARTRHNVGWRVVEALAARWRATPLPADPLARGWRAEHAGHEVTLLQPLTFMNVSGEAVGAWWARHGAPERMLVVSDDVYLPLGTLRLRAGGSSGGHRGLESIEQALGHRDWPRLRIGVGAADSSAALREHVLEAFGDDEVAAAEEAVVRAADSVECWLDHGLVAAMNRFNRREPKEETEA